MKSFQRGARPRQPPEVGGCAHRHYLRSLRSPPPRLSRGRPALPLEPVTLETLFRVPPPGALGPGTQAGVFKAPRPVPEAATRR